MLGQDIQQVLVKYGSHCGRVQQCRLLLTRTSKINRKTSNTLKLLNTYTNTNLLSYNCRI